MYHHLLQKFGERVLYGFGFGLGMGLSFKLFKKKEFKHLTNQKNTNKN